MPPKTKPVAKTVLGQASSVLTDEFFQYVQLGDTSDDSALLPFKGPLQLPTVEQVVKLFFFLKEQVGLRNSKVSQDDIAKRVSKYIGKYWTMAGFMTMSETSIRKKILKEVENYQKINKNKNRVSQTESEKRQIYLESVKKLFDIAAPNLEEKLVKDRLLDKDDENTLYRAKDGYTRKTEDISFLEDQRGERKMVMGERDKTYEKRKENSYSKKVGKGDSTKSKVSKNIDEEVVEVEPDNALCENDDDGKDSDFINNKVTGKERTILVELPRDIMNNNEVCSMLDRTATTSRNAVGIVSSILKSGKIDGQSVNLDEFSLSHTTLHRKRVNSRTVVMEKAMQEFKDRKPKYPALHWDGAMMKDITGSLQENESILVSGAPHYVEGKLLSVTKLIDEEGKPTSTGEAQASAVLEQIQAWDIEADIVAFVFDTTASNTGRKKGATVRLQQILGRPVFFLGCRHHISELVVKAVWYSVFEEDLSPENKFFSEIKED